jgi:large subunit ribosomal protein L28
MAKCEICGKSVSFGIKVSHSHRRSNKMWKPNVRKVRAIENGQHKRIYACTRCLRSGKVERGYGAGVNPNAVVAEEA